MTRLTANFRRLAAVALSIGLAQALIESLCFGWLYRDLLFAPYRFFTIQSYDAFAKIYFVLADQMPLPELLETFTSPGFMAKLSLFPQLAAINAFVAIVVAIGLAPLALWVDVDRDGSRGLFKAGVLVGILSLVVHLWMWVATVKVPLDPTIVRLGSNLIRDFVYDGVLFSVVVLIASVAVVMFLSRRSRTPAVAAVGVCLFAALSGALSGLPGAEARQGEVIGDSAASAPAAEYNVVLISIDSLRADHMSAYGYPRETTPAISALAAEGVLFEQCRSTTSWTLPAHMSMLTGRSLLGHGVITDDRRLGADVPTLAEQFKAAGYATGAVVSAPYVEARYGFARGFDDYDDETISFATNNESYRSVTGPLVVDTATDWIEANEDQPFFLFLHFWDVHYDFAPGPPYDRMFDPDYDGDVTGNDFYFSNAIHAGMEAEDLDHVIALYDGEIRLVDDQIARLRKALEELDLTDNTIFVVTADHGDEFFEHAEKGHHRTLYEEVLHVPLVFYVPGGAVSQPGRRVESESSIIDIAPTLLGLAGIEKPAGLEGYDYSAVFAGAPAPLGRAVFSELYRKASLNVQVAIRTDGKEAIHHFVRRKLEVFDVRNDPMEQRPLSSAQARQWGLLAGLHDWLAVHWAQFERRERTGRSEHVDVDSATTEALRALGYVE
jgi:arylsulfatase A-like enzyme